MKAKFKLGFSIRLGRGIKTDAEKASEELRRAAGLGPADPLSALNAAKLMGVLVRCSDQLPSMTAEILAALEYEEGGGSHWSAAYIVTPEEVEDLIVNNRVHAPARREANVYHELGHQLCGHEPDEIRIVHGLPIREFSKAKEDQANTVGHALHVPKKALVSAIYSNESDEDFRERFLVSKQLFDYRMRISGARGMKFRVPSN